MALKPSKQTIGDAIPKIYKWFELFAGGFSLVSTGLRDGVTLPAGSLLLVSESARTATPIKTAKVAVEATALQKTILVHDASYFSVGDIIGQESGSGYPISAIQASGDYEQITVATAIGTATVNTVLIHSSVKSTTVLKGTANALSVYDVKVGEDSLSEGVSVLRRGTAYKNRIQPHLAGNLTNIPATIQMSESY